MPHPAAKAVPILAVAKALGLKVAGRVACCFNGVAHKSGTDETPALVFQTEVNRFKCYACGVNGDSIDLVRGVRRVPFGQAIEFLQTLAADAQSSSYPGYLGSIVTSRTPDNEAIEVYCTLFGQSFDLLPHTPGGKYLLTRGIDVNLANRLQVGEVLDPRRLWDRLRDKYNDERLRSAGLMSHAGNFLFSRHSLLFFYFGDAWPKFVQARDITGKASCKELSLAGLHSPVPFNSDLLKEGPEHVLVCEGCIDTISAVQLGHPAVGVPGVTGFRDEWFPLFGGVRQVTLLFDNDSAGQRQAAELRARFRLKGIKADAQFPAQGKDVNDLLRSLSRG